MSKPNSQENIDGKTFEAAVEKARKYISLGTEEGSLAACLLVLNAIDVALELFIDLIHLHIENNQLRMKTVNGSNSLHVGYISDSFQLKEKQTLGVVAKYLSQHVYFPGKENFILLLNRINKNRNNIIHKLLVSKQINQKYVNKLCIEIFEDSEKAINVAFGILDYLHKIRIQAEKSNRNS